MDRKDIQGEAVDLSMKNKHVLLSWATGVGKSKAAADIVKHTYTMKKWLLVCKETNHIDNWEKEFRKHGYDHLWESHVEKTCYASLHKYENKEYNLILDEVHATSELRADKIKTIKSDKIISLGATVSNEIKDRLTEIEPFIEYNITLSQAIKMKILPEPEIFIKYIKLDNRIARNKVMYTNRGRKYTKMLTDLEYYQNLTNSMNYWYKRYNKEFEEYQKIKMLREGLRRKVFLAGCKMNLAKEVIDELRSSNKRFICFTGSIAQCEEIGTNIVHSKIDKKNRQEVIDKFNSLEIDEIYAVDMLQESMNLNDINAGIIVQLDNQEKSTIQMIGRALRSLAPEVYILLVKDSQDEVYANKALSGIDKKYIKYK
jgi:superfamily II DNA or RNA helicase